MNPSRLFIVRPIATSFLMFAIFLTGLVAYQLLPVSSLPQVDYPTIQVTTFYPGASPEVMASAITAPLERQFGSLMPGLNQMTSTSSSGASLITLQFSLDVTLDVAEQEVQAAINAASNYLPRELPFPPIYNKVNPADAPILTLALTSKTLPLSQVEDFADTRLAQKISQLPGVGLVSLNGGQRPAIRIQVNPTALSAYGLTLENIRSAITAANVNAAKGNFDGPQLSYTINSNDQLISAEEYQPLIVAYKNNAPIRLQDVAHVINGVENARQAAWMNTTPAIIMNIQRQPGTNVINVVDRIKQLLPQLSHVLPAALQVTLLTDRTDSIRASIHDVQLELILAVILVISVIFLFLKNLPATFIPSMSVPLSLIGTFGIMYLMGFSLNNLTLMGLTIATGFVVDDAIVMIENIARYLEQGDTPLEAALKGSGQIAFTIISLTVSLIAVLIPLLFMTDVIGLFFREFAITVSVTILISAIVSLTLTPMLCAYLLKHQKSNNHNKLFNRLVEKYRRSLHWVLGHQPLVLLITVATLILTGLLLIFIPKGFFPLQDTGVIQGISESSQSISFAAMSQQQKILAETVLKDPAVANISTFIGIDGTNTTLNSGRMLITLKPLEARDMNASHVIQRLQPTLNKIPGITLYLQPLQTLSLDNRVSRTQYQYTLSGANANEVSKWTTLLVKQLRTISTLQDVASDQLDLGLKTQITFDRDTAAKLGITTQLIDNILYDAFGQRQISTIFTQRNQYRVILETLPEFQNNPLALNSLYINSSSNGMVPLAVFTRTTQGVTPLIINRQGQFPVATISFNLAPDASLGNAMRAIQTAEEKIHLPLSIQTGFEGVAKIFQHSLQNEFWLVLAAIIVVYIILGILYESFIHPVTILSTLPSAAVGALIALILSNNEFSIIALIGIILLIGIVMKNAILMIDFALEQERKYKKSARDAIYDAALLRFRPILMTTMAALLSAVPLAFGSGMGSELRQPLGIAIIGGLVISQLLTLFTTPVIYLTFDRLQKKFLGHSYESL